MKVVSFLFAAFFFCLAIAPCNDLRTCEDEAKTGYQVSDTDHQDHGSEEDSCSPLCICQCCSAHAQQAIYFSFSLADHTFNKPENNYIIPAIDAPAHNFWQPPKLT